MIATADLAPLLQAFFTDRLMAQRQASPHTIASYRDTFCLLLQFIQQQAGKAPFSLSVQDLDAPLIGAFLQHLEQVRGNSPRSRNVRLAAVHAFFHYVALHAPDHGALAQRVLAIPPKRFERAPIEFLTRAEIDALLDAPDQATWIGRRDRTLLLLAAQTGLRVSELTGLRCQDVTLGHGAYVHCLGKGRKARCTPLRKETAKALREWLRERQGGPSEPLFPSRRGTALSRDSVEHMVRVYATSAAQSCSSLQHRRISPHVLRHSAAMDLLQHGVDSALIALWLGHESVETTQIYLHADMQMKEKAMEKTSPANVSTGRYQPDDSLLAFLESLLLCRMESFMRQGLRRLLASRSA